MIANRRGLPEVELVPVFVSLRLLPGRSIVATDYIFVPLPRALHLVHTVRELGVDYEGTPCTLLFRCPRPTVHLNFELAQDCLDDYNDPLY